MKGYYLRGWVCHWTTRKSKWFGYRYAREQRFVDTDIELAQLIALTKKTDTTHSNLDIEPVFAIIGPGCVTNQLSGPFTYIHISGEPDVEKIQQNGRSNSPQDRPKARPTQA